MDVARRQPLLVGAEQRALPHGRGRLKLVHRARPRVELHQPHPQRDRARRHHHDVLATRVQLGHLLADAVEHVAAHVAGAVGDDRGAKLGDDGHRRESRNAAFSDRRRLDVRVA